MSILTMLRVNPSSVTMQSLAMSWLAASVLLLSGCNVVIQNPADQSTVAAPTVAVKVGLPWLYRANTFWARLDNDQDVTSQFAVDAQLGIASANLTVTPGQHVLDSGACWGLNIYFVQQPPWPVQGCSSAHATFTAVQPVLNLGPAGLRIPVSQSGTATVQAVPVPSAVLTVTLLSSSTSKLVAPAPVTIPANSAVPVNISLQGVGPGLATLSASATGYTGASLSVSVPPHLTALAPTSGPPGTVVTITGAGFVAPVTVKFGTAAPLSVTPSSSTQLSVTVPQGLAAATIPVTVTSNMQTSAALNFAVAAAPSNATTLFRGTNDRIEIIQFTANGSNFSSSTFGTPTTVMMNLSAGMLSVGLCRDGSRLAWAGAANVNVFNIVGTASAPALSPAASTPLPSALSGVGTACVFLPTVLVRGMDTGVDNLNPAVNPIAKFGSFSGAFSSIGAAMIASPPRYWRSYSLGLEEYNLTTASAPNRVANVITNMTGSNTGTALAWLVPGSTMIRATNLGIDVISVTGTTPAKLGSNNTGGTSSMGVGVGVVGTRVIRGTDMGIEVYDVSTPATPVRCAFNNSGGSSATGVAVVAAGTVAFRATNVGIEAYDISGALTMTCSGTASGTIIPAPVQLQAGLGTSTTGVALVGP